MILVCYGTRPEWIKIKPLLKAMDGKIPYRVLYTGQHKHIGNFYHDISISISEDVGRLNSIVSSILTSSEGAFRGIDYVLVQGDTASAYAMALAAFHNNKKIIHLEAGLRTYDNENPYPEEAYRQMISRVSNINLCATADNFKNLVQEKCSGKNFVVGNTVLDNLKGLETEYGDTIIITLHRRENHAIIDKWFEQIDAIAKKNANLKFVLPIHPNPNILKHRNLLKHVSVVEPMSHKEIISRISKCRFLISDSGGLQEEASFLNKKIIVCRESTERSESLGSHSVLCRRPLDLKNIFENVNNSYYIDAPCPYGDGEASQKIVKILLNNFEA